MNSPSCIQLSGSALEARFSRQTGELLHLRNRLTSETMAVTPHYAFQIEFESEVLRAEDCPLCKVDMESHTIRILYRNDRYEIEIVQALAQDAHYLQRRLVLRPLHHQPYLIRRIDLQAVALAAPGWQLLPFQHGQCRTYFLRGPQTSFLFGVQVPVLDAEQTTLDRIVLGYPVNVRFPAGEPYQAETLFWATGQLTGHLAPPAPHRVKECYQSPIQPDMGESQAMVAMVKPQLAALPRRVVAALNGCQNHTSVHPYEEPYRAGIEADKKLFGQARDMLGDCIIQPFPTWAGANVAISKMTSTEEALPPLPAREEFLAWAADQKFTVSTYCPIKGIWPWNFDGRKLFNYCKDRVDWLAVNPDCPIPYNCPVNRPFMDWFTRVLMDDFRRHDVLGEYMLDEASPCPRYQLSCQSKEHDHLPGDVSYGYFLARRELYRKLRAEFGARVLLNGERPQMDCGIWDALYLDSLYTLSEELDGVTCDMVRTWSRIRYYYHFVPPSIDEVAVKHFNKENLDYLMLSVLAVSRNYIFCEMPVGWSRVRLRAVRRWVDWARQHADLMDDSVFLPDWPGQGHCDGYVRARDGQGYAFFFNSNDQEAAAELPLDESVGLAPDRTYRIEPECVVATTGSFSLAPVPQARQRLEFRLPAHVAVLLRISYA